MIVAPTFKLYPLPTAGLQDVLRVGGTRVPTQSIIIINYTALTFYLDHGSGNTAQASGDHFLRVLPGWFVTVPLWDEYVNFILDTAPDGTTGVAVANAFLYVEVSGLPLNPVSIPLVASPITGTVTVTGTVAISNFPAVQSITGAVQLHDEFGNLVDETDDQAFWQEVILELRAIRLGIQHLVTLAEDTKGTSVDLLESAKELHFEEEAH